MNGIQVQIGAHLAGGQDVAQVAQQAIRNIGCRMGHAAQCHAQRHAWGGALHALAHGLGSWPQAGATPEHFEASRASPSVPLT